MTNEVILRNRESGAVFSLLLKKDGSLWTDEESVGGARKVFDNLFHAASQHWAVEQMGKLMEVFVL